MKTFAEYTRERNALSEAGVGAPDPRWDPMTYFQNLPPQEQATVQARAKEMEKYIPRPDAALKAAASEHRMRVMHQPTDPMAGDPSARGGELGALPKREMRPMG